MIDDTAIRRDLDELVPLPRDLQPDWADVRRRVRPAAAEPRRGILRRARQRPLLVALAALVIALVPVSALAVTGSEPWGLLGGDSPVVPKPAKGTGVVLISEGRWDGQPWALTAYRTDSGQLCLQVSVTPKEVRPQQGSSGCGRLPSPRDNRLQWGSGTLGVGTASAPAYVAGTAPLDAAEIVIRLGDGTVVRTKALDAPDELGASARFYMAELPSRSPTVRGRAACRERARQGVASIVVLDADGKTIAGQERSPVELERIAGFLCNPPTRRATLPANATAATASIRPVRRIEGPNGAVVTLAVGKTVPVEAGRFLPSGAIEPITIPSRCWRVSFGNGESRGTCSAQTKRPDPASLLDYYVIDRVGRDIFVIAHAAERTGPPVAKMTLELPKGVTLETRPIAGIAVFAIPDPTAGRGSRFVSVVAYDAEGRELGRRRLSYLPCPSGSC